MGCDIHAHIEIKIPDGNWLYYAPIRISRDYDLFSRLANVRNTSKGDPAYIKPISEPRGLPDNTSYMTKLHAEVDGGDGHSHSWISSNEFVTAVKTFKFDVDEENRDKVYLFGNGLVEFKKYREDYPKFVKDFRMVFWFDN
jgi:hypothetical protein